MMRWSIFALVWCAAGSARAQPPPAVEPGTAPVAEPGTGPVAEPAPAAEPVAPPVTASEAEAAPVTEAAPAPDAASAAEAAPAPEATASAVEVGAQPEHAFSSEDSALDLEAEAEIARLLGEEGGASGPALRLYGFTDFTFSKLLMPKDNPFYVFFEESSTFYVGNFNLYLDADLDEDFRALSEVRFLYLPHGQETEVTPEGEPYTRTFAGDYADVNRDLRWGSIEIERAWLDYTVHRYVTLRFGQYLTPYGIWNVDHGSPVVVATRRPYIVGEQLFPERQTGLQAYGSLAVSDDATLGYHLTLSNGRGPIDSYADLDENKSVGGRAYIDIAGHVRLRFGGSIYHGRYTDKAVETEIVSPSEIRKGEDILTQYDETALALDAKLEYEGLLLQSELVHNQRAYTEPGRPTTSGSFGVGSPIGFASDDQRWGAYGLLGYRIAAIDLMPYAYLEFYDLAGVLVPDLLTTQLGLNYRPSSAVVAKIQYTYAGLPSAEGLLGDANISAIETQIAWAF